MSAKVYVLPLLSALLGILAFDFPTLSWLGFVFIVPLFLFFSREKSLWILLLGTSLFRSVFAAGVIYFAFEPLGWLVSLLIFLGLPLSFFMIRRYLGMNAAFAALPFLWAVWDILEARFTFLPAYVMVAGSALGPSPFLGIAVSGGISGLTLFAALANFFLAALFVFRRSLVRFVYLAAFVFVILGGWSLSANRIEANAGEYSRRSGYLTVAAVSTNQDFDRAFSDFESDALRPEERRSAQGRILEALQPVKDELRSKPIDLIILPEDMIDIELWGDADQEAKQKFGIENGGLLIQAYRSLAKEFNANLAATMTTIEGGRRYNTTLFFNRYGELISRYNKVRLAIGGEYWPFGNWRPFYWNISGRLRPQITAESPIFNIDYQYTAGETALLKADDFSFASPICVEAHYPGDLKGFKADGADFLSHTSNNRWLSIGLNQYLHLTDNLRRIEAVRLKTPIVINGRGERAGFITPDGRIESVPFDRPDKDYNIYFGKLQI